ncbi:MAG: AmmeMemoRadiSam system protein B, partial [Dehalococcoidia bacterium]
MKARRPAVSGMFYAGSPEALQAQIEWCYTSELGPGVLPQVNSRGSREIVAIVVPHAGYSYSGPVAAHAYRELAEDGLIDTAVILGPNHTGIGPPVSVWTDGAWTTPLGRVEVDEAVGRRLSGGIMVDDETAHIREHSIEVQIPWLQHLYDSVRIVPIAMMAQDIETARTVGKALSTLDNAPIIIASSDFSHYEPHSAAAEKDGSVIEAIISLDEQQLYERCQRLRCTMCGYGPVASAIVAARQMGVTKVSLLKYAT